MCGSFKKGIAAATLFFYSLSAPGPWPSSAYAQFVSPAETGLSARGFLGQPIKLPARLGSFDDLHWGSQDQKPGLPFIVHIQTAHGDYPTQKAIIRILNYLRRHEGLDRVLVEGASGELEPEQDRYFRNPSWNRAVAENRLKQGRMSGAAFFLLNNKTVRGFGLESPEAYRENRSSFLKILKALPETENAVRNLKLQIERLYSQKASKALLDFSRKQAAFEDEKIDFSAWTSELKSLAAETLNLNLEHVSAQKDWPALVRFFWLRKTDALPKSERKKDSSAVFDLGGEKMAEPWRTSFKSLQTALNSADGRPAAWHYGEVRMMAERWLTAQNPEQVREKAAQLKPALLPLMLQNEIRPGEIQSEIERLTLQLESALSRQDDEKKLTALRRDFMILQKLLRGELSFEEYQNVLSRLDELRPGRFMARLKALGGGTEAALSDSLFENALNFYRGAKERELSMADNIEEILKRESSKGHAVAVVTGGFHAAGLKEALSRRGFSYGRIIPSARDFGQFSFGGKKDSKDFYRLAFLDHSSLENTVVPERSHIEDGAGFAVSRDMLERLGLPEVPYVTDREAAIKQWASSDLKTESEQTSAVREFNRSYFAAHFLRAADFKNGRWTFQGNRSEVRSPVDWNTPGAPDTYARFSGDQGYQQANQYLMEFAEVRPGQTIADLGSGTGAGSELIARHVGLRGKVIGIELSPTMVAHAEANKSANVEYRTANAGDFTAVVPEAVDGVMAFNSMHLMPDPESLFKMIIRKLPAGGRLSFNSTFSAGAPSGDKESSRAYEAFGRAIVEITAQKYPDRTNLGKRVKVKFADVEQYKTWAQAAGFENIRIENRGFDIGLDRLIDFFQTPGLSETLMPQGIPSEVRNEIIREAVERVKQQGFQSVRRNWLFFSAQKPLNNRAEVRSAPTALTTQESLASAARAEVRSRQEIQNAEELVRHFPQGTIEEFVREQALMAVLYGGSGYFHREAPAEKPGERPSWKQTNYHFPQGLAALLSSGSLRGAERERVQALIEEAKAWLIGRDIHVDKTALVLGRARDVGHILTRDSEFQNLFFKTFLGKTDTAAGEGQVQSRMERVEQFLTLSVEDQSYLRHFENIFIPPMQLENSKPFAVRVQHNSARGPFKGGIRVIFQRTLENDEHFMRLFNELKPFLTLAELRFFLRKYVLEETLPLSFGMTSKTAVAGIPYGGGKGTLLAADVYYDSESQQFVIRDNFEGARAQSYMAALTRGMARSLAESGTVNESNDIPAADLNSAIYMSLMADEHLEVVLERLQKTTAGFSRQKTLLTQKISKLKQATYAGDITKRENAERDLKLIQDLEEIPQNTTASLLNPFYLETISAYLQDLRERQRAVPRWVRPLARAVGTYTSKPEKLSGSIFRSESTGFGGIHVLKEVLRSEGSANPDRPLEGLTAKLMGMGGVGGPAADKMLEEGVRLQLISEGPGGGVLKPDGFTQADVKILRKIITETRGIKALNSKPEYTIQGSSFIEPARIEEEFLSKDSDIAILAAVENAIHAGNVNRARGRIWVELANGGIAAYDRLLARGALVVPDTLGNAGGVIVSYFEWIQNLRNEHWPREKVIAKLENTLSRSVSRVAAVRREFNTDWRTAADILMTREVLASRDGERKKSAIPRSEVRSPEVPAASVIRILFADNPANDKTMAAVREDLNRQFGSQVELIADSGMGKDPLRLKTMIERERPSVILVRSDTTLFKEEPDFLKIAYDQGVRAIIRMGAGTDNINSKAAAANGIAVIRTNGNENSVANLAARFFFAALGFGTPLQQPSAPDLALDPVWAQIVDISLEQLSAALAKAGARGQMISQHQQAVFREFSANNLKQLLKERFQGKTIGLVGFGPTSRAFAEKLTAIRRLSGVDFTIMATSPSLDRGESGWEAWADARGILHPGEGPVIGQSEILSFHLPKTDKPYFDAKKLNRAAKLQVILNTARHGVIDPQVWPAFLARKGALYFADVDMAKDGKPIADITDLRTVHPEQVLVTPHIAASTKNAGAGVEARTLPTLRATVSLLLGQTPQSEDGNPDIVNQTPIQMLRSEVRGKKAAAVTGPLDQAGVLEKLAALRKQMEEKTSLGYPHRDNVNKNIEEAEKALNGEKISLSIRMHEVVGQLKMAADETHAFHTKSIDELHAAITVLMKAVQAAYPEAPGPASKPGRKPGGKRAEPFLDEPETPPHSDEARSEVRSVSADDVVVKTAIVLFEGLFLPEDIHLFSGQPLPSLLQPYLAPPSAMESAVKQNELDQALRQMAALVRNSGSKLPSAFEAQMLSGREKQTYVIGPELLRNYGPLLFAVQQVSARGARLIVITDGRAESLKPLEPVVEALNHQLPKDGQILVKTADQTRALIKAETLKGLGLGEADAQLLRKLIPDFLPLSNFELQEWANQVPGLNALIEKFRALTQISVSA